jgi:hypothetical protein
MTLRRSSPRKRQPRSGYSEAPSGGLTFGEVREVKPSIAVAEVIPTL